MLYYYAHSGHQFGLERVRRGVAVLKKLRSKGFEVQLLVNDFRAGLAAKNWGGEEYVTLETIQDIDAIAMVGDSVIIDSPEDDHGRLVKFCSDFSPVWRLAESVEDKAIYDEKMISKDSLIIDDTLYLPSQNKTENVVYFLGDSDYGKIILNNKDFFASHQMELLLGNYFFVKYENDLEKIFTTLHEPEDYVEVMSSAKIIVTSSSQTAIEAKLTGAKVIYLNIDKNSVYEKEILANCNITVVDGFDSEGLNKAINNCDTQIEKKLNLYNIDEIMTLL